MAIGPVQILVIGFDDPQFKGDIMEELHRLRDRDVVRLVDLLVVKKNDDGTVERVHTSDLSQEEAEEFGATVGALIGLGAAGEEGMEAGAVLGAEAGEEGSFGIGDSWYVDDAIPPGTAAAIALIEHRWALPLREKIGEAGGFHLADAWIHPADLIAIGMLAAEDAEGAGAKSS
jgi:uncharacterized membrane protein